MVAGSHKMSQMLTHIRENILIPYIVQENNEHEHNIHRDKYGMWDCFLYLAKNSLITINITYEFCLPTDNNVHACEDKILSSRCLI